MKYIYMYINILGKSEKYIFLQIIQFGNYSAISSHLKVRIKKNQEVL